jgi:hypothetical protein
MVTSRPRRTQTPERKTPGRSHNSALPRRHRHHVETRGPRGHQSRRVGPRGTRRTRHDPNGRLWRLHRSAGRQPGVRRSAPTRYCPWRIHASQDHNASHQTPPGTIRATRSTLNLALRSRLLPVGASLLHLRAEARRSVLVGDKPGAGEALERRATSPTSWAEACLTSRLSSLGWDRRANSRETS